MMVVIAFAQIQFRTEARSGIPMAIGKNTGYANTNSLYFLHFTICICLSLHFPPRLRAKCIFLNYFF